MGSQNLEEKAKIKEIREEIYNGRKEEKFYKENSFASACYYLTLAFENIMNYLMSPAVFKIGLRTAQVMQDNKRGAYREALKNVYKFCKRETLFSPAYDSSKLQEAYEEIDNAEQFNIVRHMFEKWEMGRLEARLEDKKLVFSRTKTSRSDDADIYNKILDDLKPEDTRKTNNAPCSSKLMEYMSSPEYAQKWDEKKQRPKTKTFFKQIKESAYQKILLDAEEKSDYNFREFTLENFREIYAVLLALGVMKFNYYLVNTIHTPYFCDNKPIIVMSRGELIEFIQENTKLGETCISKVLEYLIYDPEFHEDKIGIFQPLFCFNDIVFYSPLLVYFSFAQDKFLYIIKEKKQYNQVISQLAKNKEYLMTDEILDFIEEKSQLSFEPNYIIYDGTIKKAEYDIVLYDDDRNKVLLVELKWFFKADTERQMMWTDRKLSDAVSDRREKEKIFKQNARQMVKDIFGEVNTEPEIMSCIVSRNWAGSTFVHDDIPVLDEYLFKAILEDTSFNFDALFKKMKSKDYLPNFTGDGIIYVEEMMNYAGYEIHYPQIGINNK